MPVALPVVAGTAATAGLGTAFDTPHTDIHGFESVFKDRLADPATWIIGAGVGLGAKGAAKNLWKRNRKSVTDLKDILPKFSSYATPLYPVTDKTAGPISGAWRLGKNFVKGTAGWAGLGAVTGTVADAEGREREGIVKTFWKKLHDPKLWLASAVGHTALGAYGKVHGKLMGHLARKGGKLGATANFLKNNKFGKYVLDPTGAYSVAGMGLGVLGVPTPANALMDYADPENKAYAGLKGKFWEPDKKYKSQVQEDSF